MNLSRRHFLKSTAVIGTLGTAGRGFAADKIKPDAKSALIVTDVQNCFVDGGTLPVKGGAEIVPVINKLAPAFENIVITQDWHKVAKLMRGKHVFDGRNCLASGKVTDAGLYYHAIGRPELAPGEGKRGTIGMVSAG